MLLAPHGGKPKGLLLDAAEKSQIAGNAAAEKRVRSWEKNVKTQKEFLASLPDQPESKHSPTDPEGRFDPSKPFEIVSVPSGSKYTARGRIRNQP